jgi:hypothetical protein
MNDPHTDGFSEQNIDTKKIAKSKPKLFLDVDKAPERAYCRGYTYYTLHAGQLKLAMEEIYFLTNYAKKGDYIVYIGAASFIHGIINFKMFPSLKWILIDPGNFDRAIVKISNIKKEPHVRIFQKYFTDDTAKKLSKELPMDRTLFISDIRRTADEEDVWEDMEMQQKWVRIMKPRAFMMKFRLPWYLHKKVKYLDGKIFIQQFSPSSSTETRLIGTDHTLSKEWDCKKYESQMFYHNTITRVKIYNYFPNVIKEINGMDRCWDCIATIMIIKDYLIKWKKIKSPTDKDLIKYTKDVIYTSLHMDLELRYLMFIAKFLSRRDRYPIVMMKLLDKLRDRGYQAKRIIKLLIPIVEKYKKVISTFDNLKENLNM